MSTASYFITTTVPYVNAKPHIGHAQEFILTDALARFYHQSGSTALLQSGSDDNSSKNILAAQALGIDTKTFVDQNAAHFENLWQALKRQPDFFVRTSSPEHAASVRAFLGRLKEEDLYIGTYAGLYCAGCEDFFAPEDLVEGLCPDHRKAPDHIEEENIFFRLSRYQKQIFDLIQQDQITITPSWRKKEILSFISQGLTDISLSRSSLRTQGWGIPFPGRKDQSVYVWIDALINYISGAGYGRNGTWSKIWSEDVYKIHVIGKNVWKFHAIYWPALLISAGLPLPNEIVIHGFLTNEGVKISKSLGNGVDPLEIISRYGADALRFYLLGSLSWENDSDFVEQKLVEVYNSELANKLGNLCSRLLKLRELSGLDFLAEEKPTGKISFQDLRGAAFQTMTTLNAEINHLKPWELIKTGEIVLLQTQLARWISELVQTVSLLSPLIPEGAQRFENLLQKSEEKQLYPRR